MNNGTNSPALNFFLQGCIGLICSVFKAFKVSTVKLGIGCGKTDKPAGVDQTKEQKSVSKLNGTVKVAGSTSVQPLAEELAEGFMKNNPGVNVSVQGGGSSAGIEGANTKNSVYKSP